jgi:hypothetical protein
MLRLLEVKMNFKEKECTVCKVIYLPTGRCSKYCSSCKEVKYKEMQKRGQDTYNRKRGRAVGVGSGGTTGSGKDNPYYKNGIGIFHKIKGKIKEERRYCERCNKDLKEATRHYWCLHHKDHDRTNNDVSNFELLCKRCHQIEHECFKAFEGATTRVKRDSLTGRYKRIEAPDTEM